jgi:hypothetical protein
MARRRANAFLLCWGAALYVWYRRNPVVAALPLRQIQRRQPFAGIDAQVAEVFRRLGPDPVRLQLTELAQDRQECHYADAGFQLASTLTLRTALLALRYALWDSDLERLVPFRLAADS